MEEGARSYSKGIADVGWLPAGVPLPVTICQTMLDPFCMIFSVLPLVRRMDYPLDYPAQHDCVLVAISWTRFPFPAS